MGACRKIRSHPKFGQARAGPLLGFLMLLPYLFLPVILYGHLAQLWPAVTTGLNQDGPVPVLGQAGRTPLPSHDVSTCPICRWAASSQDYVSSPAVVGLPQSSWVEFFPCLEPVASVITSPFLVSGPRAPPISL